MRLLREDHQTGSRRLDLIAYWDLPAFLVFTSRTNVGNGHRKSNDCMAMNRHRKTNNQHGAVT